jgi:AraC-like DNA-binding protein|tara:strand:- start:3798 stop:4895 length:1098 start_codon:yes stop_codon:yes gene_type:complete
MSAKTSDIYMNSINYFDEYEKEKQKILNSYFADAQLVLSRHKSSQEATLGLNSSGGSSKNDGVIEGGLTFNDYLTLLGDIEINHTLPGIGLELGCIKSVKNFGIYGYALMSSSTLSKFNSVADRIFSAIYAPLSIKHERIGDYLQISYLPTEPLPMRGYVTLMEQVFMCGVALMKAQLPSNLQWRDCKLVCNYPKPTYYKKYHDYFEGDIEFDGAVMQLYLPYSWMSTPLNSGDDSILSLCNAKLDSILGSLGTQDSLVEKVRIVLLSSNFNELPDASQIAAFFHIAERTLRYKLSESGTTFRNIRNEVRHELAKRYLYETNLSIQEIAFSLGYQHVQNFYRAFLNDCGMTPDKFRKQHSRKLIH